jgi:hypothetical protein
MRRTSLGWVLLALVAAPAQGAQSKAFVVTSDFASGALSVVNLDTRAVSVDVAFVHSDATARWHGGLLYIVNRLGGDNIQVIDPNQSYATIRQFTTGNGSNPQDIAFVSPTKAYVTLYGSSDLMVVDPSTGTALPAIPLGSFADSDGIPEMHQMMRVGNRLFVSAQRLTNFTPSNPSVVVVVDTDADTVLDADPGTPGKQAIALQGRNPTTRFAYDVASGRLLLGCTGAYGALDGGVEWVNPVTMRSEGFAVTEAALGGDVLDLVWNRSQHSYAIVSDASFNTCLVSWSAANGTKLDDVYCPGGFSLTDADLNDRGELYVCNGSLTAPGVYVYDAGPDTVLAGPLGTGLPPNQVTFDEVSGVALAVRPASGVLEFAGPWPQPARGTARFTLRLESPARARIEAFDLAGRRLRTLLDAELPPGPHAVEWRLDDDRGARLPAGVYLVRAESGRGLEVRRVVVLP